MSSQHLDALTIQPTSPHTATVIFIHGLGDSGHGWRHVAEQFISDPALSHIKWVLPHAPRRPVTLNGGAIMPAWFDVYETGTTSLEDVSGEVASARAIGALVDTEIQADSLSADRIVLGGFSQGCAIAALACLTSVHRLAGLAALSGRVPARDEIKKLASPYATDTPIFWAHGTTDPVIHFESTRKGVDFLKTEVGIAAAGELGAPGIDFRAYAGLPHSTSEQELSDLGQWLKKVVPGQAPK